MYQVNATRTEYGWAEIEAKDEDEAREIALSGDQDFNWMNEDFGIDSIEEVNLLIKNKGKLTK